MDITTFSKQFTDLYEELIQTELLWEDDASYYYLYNRLDDMITKINAAQPEELEEIYKSEGVSLPNDIEAYKADLPKYPELSDDQITRIIVLNRMQLLIYQYRNKMKDDVSSVNFLLSDKLILGCLLTGLNGPYHQLYLKELLDSRHLLQAVDYISKTKPVVEKYGKAVSFSDRAQLSEMSAQELPNVIRKILGESPIEFLARFPGYKDGFLEEIEQSMKM